MTTPRATAIAAALLFALLPFAATAEGPAKELQATIEEVARKFPDVTHVDAAKLEELKASGSAVLVDARSAEEFAMSHLEGAVNIDAKSSGEDFAKALGANLKGKTAVIYCAVGMRSSKLAQRVADAAKAAGAHGVASLKGGIFAWANTGHLVVDASGPTNKVHGYDPSWGKLIEKR